MTGATLREGQADLPSASSTKSYWHREPSKALLGHRTTAKLPATADVVVVGSGIAGSFAARSLMEEAPGTDVVMLEAREACWGATGRNGGHCQPNVYTSDPAISNFELATYEFLRDLVATYDIPCDWETLAQGGVHAYYTPDLFAKASLALAERSKTHPDLASKARLVRSADELAALNIPGAVGAVVQENAASCWPYKLVSWVLEDLLKRYGASAGDGDGKVKGSGSFNLQTGSPVTHLQKLAEDGTAVGKQGDGHRWVVHTPRGQTAARHVLLCTNAYTSHLLPSFSDLIVPVRGQVAALLPGHGTSAIATEHSYVFMGDAVPEPGSPGYSRDDYLIQRPSKPHPQAEYILGGGRSIGTDRGVGTSADDWLDPVVASYLRRALPGTLKDDSSKAYGGKELEALYEWTGIMGYSRDGCPWIGEVGEKLGGGKGLWACAGFTGHGMPQAALCARAVVADLTTSMDRSQDGEKQRRGIKQANLGSIVPVPDIFKITWERVRKAREREEVKQMDAKDMYL